MHRRMQRVALALATVVATAVQVTGIHAESPAASGTPIVGVVPGSPSVPLATQPAATRDALSGVALLGYDSTCSAVLVAPGDGAPPADAPAYVLTNGHCVGLFDAGTVMRDRMVEPGVDVLAFGARADGAPVTTAAISTIRWATMKGTDLAVVELDRPLAALIEAGVPVRCASAHPPHQGPRS